MSDVNLQLVREFFELNLFRVLTHWQQDAFRQPVGDHSVRLYVENSQVTFPRDLDFVLTANQVRTLARAVVEVRAWHADRFYPSVIENNPVLSEFVKEEGLAVAGGIFDGRPFTTILVISELPQSPEPRARALQLLGEAGIGHILEFPTILQDMLSALNVNSAYTGSQTLQTLRLLKRYRLIRYQQMEFAFPMEAPPSARPAVVETSVAPDVE
ncbi:MAG: hypothetical protein HZB26_06315 [Candidatus Hydrogenedentes bacterium]|nr:hypothetical protein [Candidatus Hydrogenedentota bacterium]